ncbi:MAG: GNAT family N-acetyltransferase [Dehalococcoidales bacterium]|nr:GNAT family N-acetyltransferase [Dehalococcoidales bacterium]
MIPDRYDVIRLGKSEVTAAATTLARAFQDDPLFVYLIPDPVARQNALLVILQVMVRYGVLYGEVHTTSPNIEAVTVWLPPASAGMSFWRLIRSGGLSLLTKLSGRTIARLWRFNASTAPLQRRLTRLPHWYLGFIGVEPAYQKQGYAGKLLRYMLSRVDREHLPCFLDTQNANNVAIYQHFGFRVVEETIIPGSALKYWAMLRDRVE